MTNPIIASASTSAVNNVGITSNMSASMMAVYREIDRRYEENMNGGIDLPKINKSKFKFDNDGDFDGYCIVDIPKQCSRFVPFIMKDVVAICEDILRNQPVTDSDRIDWDEDVEDFVLEDETDWA